MSDQKYPIEVGEEVAIQRKPDGWAPIVKNPKTGAMSGRVAEVYDTFDEAVASIKARYAID